ncbi:3-hydroxyacyl-ACP dehydratase FabZ family protein [Streptomyces sp. CoH27]|uniref:3-hydroxyacyl-ACP dehydratase FabZ family protein n=1 Tax=Streptomyces sp. CoH27 TaxID=2875763 RepID=UPI001CD60C10|nr:hypothetical protein [Streptomyces sp. CoH27]
MTTPTQAQSLSETQTQAQALSETQTQAQALSDGLPDPGDLLPYGYPALQVDRIVRHTPGALEATKAVTYHELDAHLGGSRPGRFPASLTLESFLQACGLLLMRETDPDDRQLLIFGSARGVRMPDAARAGELLVHTVELVDRDEETATFAGVSRAGDGRTVLEVERAITLLRPADSFEGYVSGS